MKKHFFKQLITLALIITIVTDLVQEVPIALAEENTQTISNGLKVTSTTSDNAQTEPSDISSKTEPTVLCELVDMREESVKRFLKSDNTVQTIVYSQPVHYKENGEWKDIDNTLSMERAQDNEDINGYTNAKAAFKVKIANISSDKYLAKIEKGKYKIEFSLAGTLKNNKTLINATRMMKQQTKDKLTNTIISDKAYDIKTESDTIAYDGITYNNSDIEYNVTSTGLKENIVVSSKQASYEYMFNINADNLNLVLKDNVITAYDDNTNKEIYEIPAPYMYDSENEFSTNVYYSLTKNNSMYQLTVTADSAWINTDDRKFPVTIDPIIKVKQTKGADTSSFISSKMPNTNFYNGYSMLLAGVESSAYYNCRTLLKFDLPELEKGDIIQSAYLNMTEYDVDAYTSSTAPLAINAYKITGDWSASTVTWANQPSIDPKYNEVDYFNINREDDNALVTKTLDLTKIVKEWYDTSSTNYGIELRANKENTQGTAESIYAKFKSDRTPGAPTEAYPLLVLDYHNSKGTEDYYTYTSASAGRAGTAYVNDYTGNLYFELPGVSTGGNRLPASVYLTYNTNNSNSISFSTGLKSGYGWKLNIEQYIDKTGNADYPYKYTDADGTEHYFAKVIEGTGTKYYDEDGLGLTLVDTPGVGYTISDLSGTVYIFSIYGNLKNITDSNGNTITMTYSGGLIQSVTDGAGKVLSISNSNGVLTQIKDTANRVTSFTVSGDQLTKVTNPDGNYSTFTYQTDGSHTIKTITDPSGYKLTFAYDGKAYRVKTITESGTSLTGQTMGFDYSEYNTTKKTSCGADGKNVIDTEQFDDSGRLLSTQTESNNKQINTSLTKYTSNSTLSTGIKENNHVISSFGMRANVDNLLLNHNAESTSNWSMIKTGTSTETVGNSTYRYIGDKSLKIGVSSATSGSNIRYRQMLSSAVVKPGNTYTFSGYINTLEGFTPLVEGNYGTALLVYCYLSDGTTKSFYSDFISDATDNSINNGWRRMSISFTVPNNATDTSVNLIVKNTNGSAYFDALQLEEGNVANSYNLLENASFENSSSALYGYTTSNLSSNDVASTTYYKNGATSFSILGDKTIDKNISQGVTVSGLETDTYIISGWAKAYSVPEFNENDPNTKDRRFKMSIKVAYTDGTYVWKSPIAFNQDIIGWQYGASAIDLSDGTSAVKTPATVTIYPRYDYQANRAYFDNLSIIKDNVSSYSYDTNGNLITVDHNVDQSEGIEYYPGTEDVKSVTDAKGQKTNYVYDTKHNLTQSITQDGVINNFSNDTMGNTTQSVLRNSSSSMNIQTNASYTTDGDYISTTTDQDGYVTSYSSDPNKGLLSSITNPNNVTTNYSYHADTDQLTGVSSTVGGQPISNSYQYTKDYLTKITHNGFDYNFTYDDLGNNTGVKIGSQDLVTNSYNLNNGILNSVTYGNNDITTFNYDENAAIEKVNNVDRYKLYTDNLGNAVKQEDLINNLLYYYEYDMNGRLIRQDVEDTSKAVGTERNLYLLEYGYDLNNNVSKLVNKAGSKTLSHSFTYGLDNLLSSYTMPTGKTVSYTYDSLNRLQQYQIGTTTPITVDYSYFLSNRNATEQTTYMTTKVRYETIGNYGLKYEYDKLGNITSIAEKQTDGNYKLINSYQYDELNQLIREDDLNQGKTKKYIYDLGGNITSINEYAYTNPAEEPVTVQNTITYGYTDSNWKDKLTSYNGQTITYDEIGNPLSYNGNTYDWDNGRELKSISGNGLTASYTYDENGLRVTKTVNGIKTNYEYSNGLLLYEKKGTTELHYLYDANGSIKGIQTIDSNGTSTNYYVVTNTRGDVTQIYDVDGVLQVLYTYDTWGKILSIKDGNGNEITNDTNIGKLNSLRYRSYYYDSETSLYYLQSRYFNPEWGRFINADDLSILDSTGNILANNLYSYCENNPIIYFDPSGNKPQVTKNNPPTKNDGYVSPKGGAQWGKNKTGQQGWVDKNGNVWVPQPDGTSGAHGGGHWDVQRPDGKGYTNVYPGGAQRTGKGKKPKLPSFSNSKNVAKDVATGVTVAVTVYGVWTVGKWVVAIVAAPATGGGSLVVAGVTP